MSSIDQLSASLAPPDMSETPGRELLHLLRHRDKLLKVSGLDSTCEADRLGTKITELLESLYTSIQRNGLLPIGAAEKIRAQTGSSGSNNIASNNEGGGKKRKRKGGDRSNSTTAAQYGIHLDSNAENGEKIDLEEGRILMGLCRVLRVGKKKSSDLNQDGADGADNIMEGWEITGAACQTVTSICRHAQTNTGVCSIVVKDMMGSIAIPMLEAQCIIISKLKGIQIQENNAQIASLIFALEAAAAVIGLVRTRCTSSTAGEKLLQKLRAETWSLLNSMLNDRVIKAATVLLATFPLAGDASNSSLPFLWTKSMNEGISLINLTIGDLFPVNDKTRDEGNLPDTENHYQDHKSWIASLKGSLDETADNDSIDEYRRDKFLSRIQCLTEYVLSLIKMQGYSTTHDNKSLLFVNMPLQSLLDLSESLLSFPLAAEIKHRSLPSRLRSSPVDGGLISANAAVSIATSMRYCGHVLFDATISSCRGSAYSKARRIIDISMSNLQSSVSRGLLSVVVEGRKVDGRKDGITAQLRGSIPLRIKSIEMFRVVVLSLGSGVMSSSTSKSVCRGVVLVGGCLLEQIQRCCDNANIGAEVEWGTLRERGSLIETCSNTLAACISAFGGLIASNIRGTIDSITHTCLSMLYSVGSSSIFAYPCVKQSLLLLGMNSVCMPWGDGGRGTLLEMVRNVASMLRSDYDVLVASTSLSVMCALDAIVTPRAPALLIPSRETASDCTNTLCASDISDGIKAAAIEMANAAVKDAKKSNWNKTNEKETKPNPSKGPTSFTESSVAILTENNDDKKTKDDHQLSAEQDAEESAKMNFEVKTSKSTVEMQDILKQVNVKVMDLGETKSSNDAAKTIMSVIPKTTPATKLPDKDESSHDDSSMGDFPEIIDEGPDEEDRA